ncbi:MAG TPA: SurA N-terminal domain-containing protein [Kiritimatiellia bacterium]|nr:SurA N-terminal domain-containing protein [Kiritimatiellia bacterium]HPS09044.1 SurA N-terminal domain-containing protein [Kiritimatiellia bacterium]
MFIYHFNRLIRSRILWGFFAIIIAVAFVAVDSCFQSPQDTQTAGVINGKKIPYSQFEQTVQAIRGFGRNRDNETSARVVDRKAWEQISARLTAEKNGMASGKEEIRSTLREVPGFQGANGFDINRYRSVLADQGLTPAMYESLVSHQLAMMKNGALVDSATWISPMEMEDELAAMTDRFTVQVANVSNRFAQVEMRLTDEDTRKYYEENKASFALPDRVAVRYFAIPVSNFLAYVTVPEEDLQEYYDSHTETFSRTTTNNTTETIPYAEVRSKILAELQMEEARYCASTSVTFNIYGKLANAGSNALVIAAAQEKAAIKTSPLFGAEDTLYWVENSKEFANAAFELDPDRTDSRFGIVKGDNFIYVIEPIAHSPAHTPAYEDVLKDLRPRAMAKARSDAFQSYAKELRADLRKRVDEGKSFAEAAKAKALNVSTSITYTVSDIQNQKFDNSFSVAYGAMTLKKGEISEPVPASAVQSLFVYVQDRQPGDALAAEMMRSQIRSGIARRRNSDLFSEWLKWNLAKQDFKPSRTLAESDDETEITGEEEGGKAASAKKTK